MNETHTPVSPELDAALDAVREASRLAGFAAGVNLVTEARNQDLAARLQEIEHTANHDPLTNILNRRGLDKQYARLQQHHPEHHRRHGDTDATDSYILFIDADDFKQVNDSSGGHQAGDTVLKRIAETMQSNVRSNDLVGRWGGDEFLTVLDKITARRANEIANNIRSQVAETTPVTVSIGVCKADYAEDLQSQINQANKALKAGKAGGKNVVVDFEQLGEVIPAPKGDVA